MNLHPYQQKIVDAAPDRWGLWLSCGLGKSAICIRLAGKRLVSGKVLIITTKSLKFNWKNEIDKWCDNKELEFLVYSKEEFKRDYKIIPKVECLIWDEFHNAGNFKSQIHKATYAYIKVHNPKYIYGATATPIMSKVWSVWSLSRLLGKELMSFWKFNQTYFSSVRMGNRMIPIQKKGIEKDITDKLRLIGTVLDTSDVMELEENVHETEYFELNKAQNKAILKLDEDPTTINHMTYFTKCLQIASGTLKKGENDFEYIPCDKLERVKELVEQYPNICIVAKHTAELRLLHTTIPNSYIYDGHTKIEERQKIVDKINTEGGVLLLQAESGIGFDLKKTNVMVFYSHCWDYIKYTQCLGRNGGLRQNGKNIYIHLVTKGSLDENVLKCLERKESFDIELYRR